MPSVLAVVAMIYDWTCCQALEVTHASSHSRSLYHSIARQRLHCYKSDQLSLWSNANLEVSDPQTSEPINIKFGMDDYVGDMSAHAKIINNHPSGGVPARA